MLVASLPRLRFALAAILGLAAIASPALAQCPAAANFAAQSRGCSVRLTWTLNPATLPPSLWEIFRNTSNSTTGAVSVGVNPANDFNFDDVPPLRDTTYYYFVRGQPISAVTCPSGPQFSASASGKLLPVATLAGLSTTVGCSAVTVTWNPLPDAQSFEIRRRPTGGSPVTIGAVSGVATSYIDTTGEPGTTYKYFVIPTLTCSTGVSNFFGTPDVFWPSAPAPDITMQPVSVAVNAGQNTTMHFTLHSNADLNPTYTLRHDGVSIPTGFPANPRFGISTNVNTPGVTLLIGNAKPSDNGVYTITTTNTCGTSSQDLVLSVRTTCKADFNESGTVSVQDIFDFLSSWFAGCP